MFTWLYPSSWWSTPSTTDTDNKHTIPEAPLLTSFPGPARNAPNNGKDIKTTIKQFNKQIIVLTDSDLVNIKQKLRKTVINENPPSFHKRPLLIELDTVFDKGGIKHINKLKSVNNSTTLSITQTFNDILNITNPN